MGLMSGDVAQMVLEKSYHNLDRKEKCGQNRPI
jgi:hypothetical protein